MTRAYIVAMAVLVIVLTSGCTQFYPTGRSPAQTSRPKPSEEVEVVLEGRPSCPFQDIGTVVSNQNMFRELSITRARSKAGEVGADGIYDLQFTQTPAAVGGMVVTQHIVQAKAYRCEPTPPHVVVQKPPVLPSSSPPSPPLGGEARTALVIGNARYLSSPLRTPQNDARALHVALRDLGFDVTLVENGRRRDLITAIEAFGGTLRRKGGVGLIFYAGHGVQIKGKNYLIPVDAQVQSEVTAVAETVDVELALGTMAESGTRINVLILDACRNNPFERRWRGGGRGLAPITVSDAKGTLIAYSTDPGKTAEDGNGEHSPYAQALIEVLRMPNLTIEQVFKRVREKVQTVTAGTQTPWETSSLTGEDFFFSRR